MSCVAGERAAGVHVCVCMCRYYITLIMRSCAKGGTGPPRPRRSIPRVPFPPSGKGRGDAAPHDSKTEQDEALRAPGNYRETITALSIPRRWW